MSDDQLPPYAFLTEAPPLREGGHGCHVVAWNWLEMAGTDVRLVVTHRLGPELSHEAIAADSKIPVAFYPDLSSFRFGKAGSLKSLLEVIMFLFALPRLTARVRASGAKRLFALFGGSAWFLIMAHCLSAKAKLPLEVYLVDDLEDSARLNGQTFVARLARWIEPKVLRRAQRVFTISPGYCEHLRRKYDVRSEWLPLPVPKTPIAYQPFIARQPDVRTIVFVGAVNALYLGALKDILASVAGWNSAQKAFRIRLQFLTYTSPCYIERELGIPEHFEVRFRVPTADFHRHLRDSWAVVIPYSFEESVRLMVTTSFPSKLVSAFVAGRPILVYGPAYASLPRYFRENQMLFGATSPAQLTQAFCNIEQNDTAHVVQSYKAVIQRLHSGEHLRKILARRPSQKAHLST